MVLNGLQRQFFRKIFTVSDLFHFIYLADLKGFCFLLVFFINNAVFNHKVTQRYIYSSCYF